MGSDNLAGLLVAVPLGNVVKETPAGPLPSTVGFVVVVV